MGEYDIIVIGAGYGGASVAALLAKAGQRVALVDKTPKPAGKVQWLDRRGYKIEAFGAVGIPALNSRFHELVDTLGVADRVEFIIPEGSDMAQVFYKPHAGPWRKMATGLRPEFGEEEMARLKQTLDVGDEDLMAMASVYGAAMAVTDEELDALDDVSFADWLQPFNLPRTMSDHLGLIMNALFVVSTDKLAASEAVFTLKQMVMGGVGRYHKGGYGRVAEVCAEYVAENGGRYMAKETVTRILVENGRAVGVETKAGERIYAKAIISNAGIQPTVLKLAGAEHFPADYVARVKALEPSLSIAGCRYVLDKPIFEGAFINIFGESGAIDDANWARMTQGEWPEVPPIVIDVETAFDPEMSPIPGHQIANFQIFVSADPKSPMAEEAIARAERVINELYPELQQHIVRREPYGPRMISSLSRDAVLPGVGGEAVGLGQIVGQIGRHKPSPRTPLPGLYLVGCDAGGRGAGTHQAVDSGFHVAAMVADELA